MQSKSGLSVLDKTENMSLKTGRLVASGSSEQRNVQLRCVRPTIELCPATDCTLHSFRRIGVLRSECAADEMRFRSEPVSSKTLFMTLRTMPHLPSCIQILMSKTKGCFTGARSIECVPQKNGSSTGTGALFSIDVWRSSCCDCDLVARLKRDLRPRRDEMVHFGLVSRGRITCWALAPEGLCRSALIGRLLGHIDDTGPV